MSVNYKSKYLKYKNKYIELKYKNKYGGGDTYSWFIMKELNQEQELELDQQYNADSAEQITYESIPYSLNPDGDYSNGNNLLRREQKITITDPNEQSLFEMLKDYIKDKDVVLRVAGGWVRDKILGKENDDIDFTVANKAGMGMSGKVFSDTLCAYITASGADSGWACEDKTSASQQTQGLETATLIISVPSEPKKSFELDFVGFRSEVYSDDSRVPAVSPGTILQDTKRRDFTINALYYNINTGKIEDHVGGVRDIHRRIIRTPIDAKTSFTDDPLRILRALRFRARFQFALDEDIKTAMRDPGVQTKFREIITGGRIGQEIVGFFKEGSEPVLAFREIYECGLWYIIFGGEGNWGTDTILLMKNLGDNSRRKEITLTVLTYYFFNLDTQKSTKLQEFMNRLNIPKDLSKQIIGIHICTFAISEKIKQKPDIILWKLSDFALIIRAYIAYFDDAITVGKVLKPELFDDIDKYITQHRLKDIYAKLKFDSRQFATDFGVSGKQIKILVDLLYEWQFDNPDKSYEDALLQKENFLQ
jgi:tRNA nucleotidyltransferase/poly(A) polymerase